MNVPKNIFRQYDVRGLVDRELTPELASALGRAYTTLATDRIGRAPVIVVGRDNRPSGERLAAGVRRGIVAAGGTAIDAGQMPTPALYFAEHHLKADGGVQITGSHNPPEFNGFKLVIRHESVHGEEILELYEMIVQEKWRSGTGQERADGSVLEAYKEAIVARHRLARPVRVAVDCGNGVASLIAVRTLQALGAEVTALFCESDGTFPNHHPDPTVPENLRDLQRLVRTGGAELGIAFDGDGDRIGAVDEAGQILFGDQLLVVFGRDAVRRFGSGVPVIFDVKCSEQLPRALLEAGARPEMWKTGHSLIKARMKELKAPLAGEMSGHIFFGGDYYGFDDALFAAARLLEIVSAGPPGPRPAPGGPPTDVRHAGDQGRLPRRRQVRDRGSRLGVLRVPLRRQYDRWGSDRVSRRVGPAASLEYPAGSRDALRGDECRGARALPERGHRLARGAGRPRLTLCPAAAGGLRSSSAAVALVLALGRWGSLFLAERLWEASVSEAAALAGARRALLGLGLEIAGMLVGVLWCLLHFTAAARVALPDRAPPEGDRTRVWPAQLPRWALPAAAVVLGVLAGAGTGAWRDEVLLALDGATMGVRDPLLGEDLGRFLGAIPVRFHFQGMALKLTVLALVAVAGLHAAGGTIRFVERRLWISPRARGHLALLLAALALTLAWGCVLEPYRLAAGERGALLPSAFLLSRSVTAIQTGLGAGAAVVTFLWWVRMRGVIAAAIWGLFGLSLIGGRLVPLRGGQAMADPDWRAASQRLDSVSFGLSGLGDSTFALDAAATIAPTLWDEAFLPSALGADSLGLEGAGRTLIELPGGKSAPVWLVLRTPSSGSRGLLALSDAQVSPAGGPLFWRAGDTVPAPGDIAFRDLPADLLRPQALAVAVGVGVRGVPLDSWSRRLVLAWALQAPEAFRAPKSANIGWRLDPGSRIRAVAPFAHWEAPRARLIDGELVWESIGVLSAPVFPASSRVAWMDQQVGLIRPSLIGLVSASTGVVRVIQRDPADSVAAAWARITAPLIEPAGALPDRLHLGVGPSESAAAIRARVLEGPAWSIGRVSGPRTPPIAPPLPVAGGSASVIPFITPQGCEIRAILLTRGDAQGDRARLVQVDSARALECPGALAQRWERFPFQNQLADSIHASGGEFKAGQIRYLPTAEGFAAYQPAYALPARGGRATLVMVNVALGRRLGAGRTMAEAWRNLRGEVSPTAPGTGSQLILDSAEELDAPR